MVLEEIKLVHVIIIVVLLLGIGAFILMAVSDRLAIITDPAFMDTVFNNLFGGS